MFYLFFSHFKHTGAVLWIWMSSHTPRWNEVSTHKPRLQIFFHWVFNHICQCSNQVHKQPAAWFLYQI